MLKQKFEQKLEQKLSPRQIQMIKMLEYPSVELEEQIKKELEENPALEDEKNEEEQEEQANEINNDGEENIDENQNNEKDDFSIDDYFENDDMPYYKTKTNNYSKDDEKKEMPLFEGDSFIEFLEGQINMLDLTDKEKELAYYIIGNLDENGYLSRELVDIADDISFSQNIEDVTEKELEKILKIVQNIEPVGIAARNLQECLLIQLNKKDDSDPNIIKAKIILQEYFDEFTKKHYEKIISKLSITNDELHNIIYEILKLNPKPGGSIAEVHSQTSITVIPDFIIDNIDGKLQISLDSKNSPDIKISKKYLKMFQLYDSQQNPSKQDKEAMQFVKQKIEAASNFIEAIKQRQNTLIRVMTEILEYQKEFFLSGDEKKLKPMILKTIAERISMDISTISRVANSKYVYTEFGVFALKYFFSEGMESEEGNEVSTREIKKYLQEVIETENKQKPYKDDELAELFKKKGYKIARRTITKYREQLNIPVARMRRYF